MSLFVGVSPVVKGEGGVYKGQKSHNPVGVHHSNSSKLFQVYPKYHWNKGDFLAQAPLSSGRFLFTLQKLIKSQKALSKFIRK